MLIFAKLIIIIAFVFLDCKTFFLLKGKKIVCDTKKVKWGFGVQTDAPEGPNCNHVGPAHVGHSLGQPTHMQGLAWHDHACTRC